MVLLKTQAGLVAPLFNQQQAGVAEAVLTGPQIKQEAQAAQQAAQPQHQAAVAQQAQPQAVQAATGLMATAPSQAKVAAGAGRTSAELAAKAVRAAHGAAVVVEAEAARRVELPVQAAMAVS